MGCALPVEVKQRFLKGIWICYFIYKIYWSCTFAVTLWRGHYHYHRCKHTFQFYPSNTFKDISPIGSRIKHRTWSSKTIKWIQWYGYSKHHQGMFKITVTCAESGILMPEQNGRYLHTRLANRFYWQKVFCFKFHWIVYLRYQIGHRRSGCELSVHCNANTTFENVVCTMRSIIERGPSNQHGLTLIPAWIGDYIYHKAWDPTLYNGCNNVSVMVLK